MRVAILNSQFHTVWGMERTIALLGQMLNEKGFEIEYLCYSGDWIKNGIFGKSARITSLWETDNQNPFISIFRLFSRSWKIARFCRRSKIDVLLSNAEVCNFSAILSKLFSRKPKIVSIIHNSPKYYRDSAGWIVWLILMKSLYRFSDSLIVVSEELGEYVSQYLKLSRSKVLAISNPLDKNARAYEKSDKIWLSFVHVGRLAEVKNQEFLLKAFDTFHEKHQEATLRIIGEGPMKERLMKFSASLKSNNSVYFVGETDDVGAHLEKADYFLFCSKNEGFWRAPMEALAKGIPVITHCYEYGARELLRWNWKISAPCVKLEITKNGALVPYGDADAFVQGMEMAKLTKFDRMRISVSTIEKYGYAEVSERWVKFLTELYQ